MLATYRKIPVTVQAVQWTGDNYTEVCKLNDQRCRLHYYGGHKTLIIETLEGEMAATLGDYIIKGVEGELYPCKASVFEKTYTAETEPRVEITLYGESVPDKPESMNINMQTKFFPCPPVLHNEEIAPEWKGRERILPYLEAILVAVMRKRKVLELK